MNDFADWLSPIIVKELRQGMRARLFVAIFIILQALCFITLLTAINGGAGAMEAAGVFFWIGVGLTLCVAMPLRGITTLLGEIKGNTLELLLLTRLTAWRILLGKWLALILQTLLMVCTLLPYVMLRYFIGGVDLALEWKILGWMLLASVVMTTLTVSLSPYLKTLGGRLAVSGLGFAMFVLLGPGSGMFFGMRSMGVGGGSSVVVGLLPIFLVMVPLGILGLWEIGVCAIAPLAENHALRKRLLVLGALLAAFFFGGDDFPKVMWYMFPLFFLGIVWLSSLIEETVALPSIYRPFMRFGWLGRVIGRFFYPGWWSGLCFALVAFALWVSMLPENAWKEGNGTYAAFTIFALLETALVPLLLVQLFPTFRKQLLMSYLGAQLVMVALALSMHAILGANDGLRMGESLVVRALVPTLNMFNFFNYSSHLAALWYLPALMAALTFLLLYLCAFRDRWTIRQTERMLLLCARRDRQMERETDTAERQ